MHRPLTTSRHRQLRIDADEVTRLIAEDALLIDVFGAAQSRYDELDGTWLVSKPRHSLPGAVWLPETGRGTLKDDIEIYLKSNLEQLTEGDRDKLIVIFCVADCWMSWNAAQRISAMGYTKVHWFRHGTDAWQDAGYELQQVDPVPVDVE